VSSSLKPLQTARIAPSVGRVGSWNEIRMISRMESGSQSVRLFEELMFRYFHLRVSIIGGMAEKRAAASMPGPGFTSSRSSARNLHTCIFMTRDVRSLKTFEDMAGRNGHHFAV